MKDPDAFSQRMRKEVRRRLVDAERVAWKREAMLARLRARDRSQPPPPAAYFLASVDDEDLVAPEVPLLWDATAEVDVESSPSPPSATSGEPAALFAPQATEVPAALERLVCDAASSEDSAPADDSPGSVATPEDAPADPSWEAASAWAEAAAANVERQRVEAEASLAEERARAAEAAPLFYGKYSRYFSEEYGQPYYHCRVAERSQYRTHACSSKLVDRLACHASPPVEAFRQTCYNSSLTTLSLPA